MSLVGKVGRNRLKSRLAMGLVYGLLILGAITTLYPFLLMVSTAIKGSFDQNGTEIIPPYLVDTGALQKKYLDDKYSGDAALMTSNGIGEKSGPEPVAAYDRFLRQLPLDMWTAGFKTAPNQVTSKLQVRYQNWLREKYSNNIEKLNLSYIEENIAFQTVTPPAEMLERKSWFPPDTRKYIEWREFKATLPASFRIPVREQRMWQEFVRGKFRNQFSAVPTELTAGADSFEKLPVIRLHPLMTEFREKALPDRYANGAAEALWTREFPGPLPIAAADRIFVESNQMAIRRGFLTRNFEYVLDYILLNGRTVWNTAFFCLLAIATQLIVNPLAAYALSRYPVKQSGQILIFLLATMAFPAEVAMIPSFLLLKDLGLLNTFAALVLPTAASGYMIFLLKGFFDSLPQELFEAGQLDGAKETMMMARIALPLSKPVLGYLALIAFMSAYSAFIYAFLIAQDQQMWTLMVWIYQLQNLAPKSVMMAALTLAAVPTLVVFLFAQNVIMRGIVLPDER